MEYADFVAIYNQETILGFDFALETTMGGVEFEEVDHVVKTDEGVVDGYHLGTALQGSTEHQTANTTETVNSNFRHYGILKLEEKSKIENRGGFKRCE